MVDAVQRFAIRHGPVPGPAHVIGHVQPDAKWHGLLPSLCCPIPIRALWDVEFRSGLFSRGLFGGGFLSLDLLVKLLQLVFGVRVGRIQFDDACEAFDAIGNPIADLA
jgi:hypothetical protein